MVQYIGKIYNDLLVTKKEIMEYIAADNVNSEGFDQDNWKKILDSDYWKQPPNWTRVNAKKIGFWDKIKKVPERAYEFLVIRVSYEDYFASQLRSRYMDLEGKFRTTLFEKKDPNLSEFIKELLILSKQILETEKLGKMSLISASSLLDEAEERMVWILPKDIKISKIHELNLDLDRFNPRIKENYIKLLQKCESTLDSCDLNLENTKDNEERHKQEGECSPVENNCNASIEEIVRAINKDILAKIINTGLQIERLRSLRFWGLILLISFVLLFPMTSLFDFWTPYQRLIGYFSSSAIDDNWFKEYQYLIPIIAAWAVALSFCIIGGIGGFLSGLLQVRTTETNLELYEEAVLLFQIRPIFGGFAALVTFMLMSLGAFNTMFSNTAASCATAAFLSGFSERYFLRLLKTEAKSKETKETEEKEKPESKKSDRSV